MSAFLQQLTIVDCEASVENVYKHGRRRKIWRKKEERAEGGEKKYIYKTMLIIIINITSIEGDECIFTIIIQ